MTPQRQQLSNVEVGQVWREDDGYLVRVVGFDSRGWPFVRHINAKSGGSSVNPAWFGEWERIR